LELVLQQEALDLVVIHANGNDDGAEGTVVSGEAAADFLGGAVEAANGEEGVDASSDQESEKPAEGDNKEAAELFGMPIGFAMVIASRLRERRRGIFGGVGRHILENMTKLREKRGAKPPHPQGHLRSLAVQSEKLGG
jgi:hypothetical protein